MSKKSNKMTRRESLLLAGGSLAGIPVGAVASQLVAAKPQSEPPRFENKVALVTGSARGIGKAAAELLAKDGATVILIDIAEQIDSVKYPLATMSDLKQAEKDIKELGGTCLSFQGDIRDRDGLSQIATEVESQFGQLDILVANAGIASMERFDSADIGVWDDVIDVNLTGTANTVHAFLPLLKKSNLGKLVFVSSQLGRKGASNSTPYVAAKWGMIGFAKSLALELGQFHIACNVVCPTATATGMLNNEFVLNKLNPDNPTIEALNEKWGKYAQIPGSILSPEQVADMILFLCQDSSSHLSGAVFDVASNEPASNLG